MKTSVIIAALALGLTACAARTHSGDHAAVVEVQPEIVSTVELSITGGSLGEAFDNRLVTRIQHNGQTAHLNLDDVPLMLFDPAGYPNTETRSPLNVSIAAQDAEDGQILYQIVLSTIDPVTGEMQIRAEPSLLVALDEAAHVTFGVSLGDVMSSVDLDLLPTRGAL